MHVRRRSFIKYASLAAAGNLLGFSRLARSTPSPGAPTDYKALVCIFFFGGNDANNMVVPFDTKGYATTPASAQRWLCRKTPCCRLRRCPTLRSTPACRTCKRFSTTVTPQLLPMLALSISPPPVRNISPAPAVPTNLFSHADQQEEWQNAAASGATPTGWAGRMSDVLNGTYNAPATIPMITSVAGDTLFCNGVSTTPVSVSPGNLGGASCSEGSECSARLASAQTLLNFTSGVSLVHSRQPHHLKRLQLRRDTDRCDPIGHPAQDRFPNHQLGPQLKQIAQIIQVRAALGVQRQIFFCGIGNFDTHAGQLALQASLLSGVSPALSAFYNATVEMGVQNSVTIVHHVGLCSHLPAELQHRQRPRLGFAPRRLRRSGEWRQDVRHLPHARSRRPGRLRLQRPLGSIHRKRAVRRHAGLVVRRAHAALATVFPNIGNFSTPNLGFV